MKLVRFGPPGDEKPGVIGSDGTRLDCSAAFEDWSPSFFREDGPRKLQAWVDERRQDLPRIGPDVRWAAPVPRPGKVVCIGLNYADHAAESGLPAPPEPIIFLKAANAVVGPYDDILIPRGSTKTDWEIELGIVIGRDARYLESAREALKHIAGYCISHDVSERAFQLEHGGQWTKGKSCDTFNPLGPWLVTPDDIPDIKALPMKLRVNGDVMQDGNTSTMIFDPGHLVHYLSQFMTLETGDVISTGTPPGVGCARKPPRFLKAGDVVELSIDGLGVQRQTCRNA